jgi:signal transduction histidine kinase
VRRALIVAAHLLLVGLIGYADLLGGPDFELRPLYLLPVVSAAWYGGRWLGVVVSIAATTALFFANDFIGAGIHKGIAIPLWNTTSRLTTYLVVSLLVAHIRTQAADLGVKTEALQRESARREEYIGLFVHELRHSAAAMSLVVASLASSERITPEDRAYLERMRAQASDLEALARQLLTIGPLESGSAELTRQEVDLRELARSVISSYPQAARIDLHVPAEPLRARGDPEALRRAVDNFVRNAFKYSEETSHVTVDVFERDGHIGIDVTDEGVGFEPQDAQLLFRKYGRLRRPETLRTEGAGLGLYLTRLIVEAHGGTVSATSPGPGKGARFGLLVPRA